MSDTIFGKILRGEIPADVVHEDEQCIAFRDVAPQAPLHVLVIPREPISQLSEASSEQAPLLGHLMDVARRVAAAEGHEDAYRLVINNGADAGQSVFHLHLHVLAGRPFAWPPG